MGARRGGASRGALGILAGFAVAIALASCGPAALAAEGTGAIAGTVRAASSHEPLGGIAVAVYEAEGSPFPAGFTMTKADGEYVVGGLQGGSYKVEFSASFEEGANYVTQFYREASSLASAARVAVLEGSTTHEIDAELLTGGKLQGTVTEAEGAAPIAEIEVTVYEAGGSGAPVGYATTNASGNYTVEGLPSGSYKVEFAPGFEGRLVGVREEEGFEPAGPARQNFITQFYADASSLAAATAVGVVREATTERIDAQLLRGGEIAGTVTDQSTHAAVRDALVVALGPGETVLAHAYTDASGHYTLVGLESGSSIVGFVAPHYITQYYSNQPSFARANSVAVVRPNATSAIDAALVPKAPVNTLAPVASGIPAVGQTLSCTPGSWTGSPTPSYAYAWLRDGVPIAGAAATTYVVQPADEGNGVTCKVTATNRNGSAAAISNTLVVPVPTPPPPPAPAVKIAGARLLAHDGAVRVSLTCARARCTGTAELIEQLAPKRRHHGRARGRTLVLGKASYALAAGQSTTILVRLDASGRRALARAAHHRLALQVRVAVTGGSSVSRAVSIGRAHRR
jgi:hypothetical protein